MRDGDNFGDKENNMNSNWHYSLRTIMIFLLSIVGNTFLNSIS